MLKNLLLLSGFSTFVVIIIIGLDIYHKFTVSSLEPSTQRHIVPIDARFDTETLDKLKERVPLVVDLTERSTAISEDSNESSASPTPSPASDEAPTLASESGTIESSIQP